MIAVIIRLLLVFLIGYGIYLALKRQDILQPRDQNELEKADYDKEEWEKIKKSLRK